MSQMHCIMPGGKRNRLAYTIYLLYMNEQFEYMLPHTGVLWN